MDSKKLKALVGWLLAYFIYLGIGGAVFNAIERPLEEARCKEANNYINNLLVSINQTDFQSNFGRSELINVIANMSLIRGQGIRFKDEMVICTDNWDFTGAFFFSGTVVTTIGYGHIFPSTLRSRIFCIFYALIGIPIFALLFAMLGRVFSQSLKSISTAIDKLHFAVWIRNLVLTITFTVLGLTFFSLIPAIIFNAVESWGYVNSVYYTIITLTTIGFGDFYPAQNLTINESFEIVYKIMVYFWILFGLAFMATYLNFISERFKFQAKRIFKKKLPEKDGTNHSVSLGEENEEQQSLGKQKKIKKIDPNMVEEIENESQRSAH